jgi:hypothetical protein
METGKTRRMTREDTLQSMLTKVESKKGTHLRKEIYTFLQNTSYRMLTAVRLFSIACLYET